MSDDFPHTPGPWYLDENAPGVVFGPRNKAIATMRTDWHTEEEAAANTRLIVAAPDLLDALIQVMAELKSLARIATGTDMPDEDLGLRMARAALARVEDDTLTSSPPAVS